MARQEILVIDDEEGYRMFLRDALEDVGYAVSCAQDAETGLALAKARRFDLVITDMGLPDLHGPTLVARLRLFGCHVPIIAISGRPDCDASLATAEAYGADRVLFKPFGPRDLVTMIRSLIGEGYAGNGASTIEKQSTSGRKNV